MYNKHEKNSNINVRNSNSINEKRKDGKNGKD